jgi:hypothetical protein
VKKITETFVAPCTVDAFWRAFMDARYLRALYEGALGFKAFEVLELHETSRKLRISPKMNLPDVLAKIVGDAFAYEEHGVLDRERNEWTWRMVQPATSRLPELIATSGVVRVVAIDGGECRRSDEITLEGKLFGLGRIIEAAAEKEARSALTKEAPFFATWIRDNA